MRESLQAFCEPQGQALRAQRATPVRISAVFHGGKLFRAGFSSVEVFGGFDRRPFDYFSGETVVIAKADR